MTTDVRRLAAELLERHPAATGYLEQRHTLTHGELRASVTAEAQLFAAVGVGHGTTVALQAPPSFTQVEVLLALWRLGAQVMLVDHRLKRAEVTALCEMCQPEYLVRTSLAGGSVLSFAERYELVTEAQRDGRPAWTEHALVQFSSGSTGVPKIIGRTADSIAAELRRFAAVDGMVRPGERALLLNSTAHSFGLIGGLLHALAVGATVVFAARTSARDILAGAARDVAVVFGVPFHFALMSATTPQPLPKLRAAVSGGERMPADVAERFAATYGIPVGESYGTTESGVIAMDVSGARRPAVGPPAPGMRVRVHGGELEVRLDRTPYLLAGADRYVDGWLRTGDRATVDGSGNVHLHGRSDSLVIIGGLKVDLTELEAVLRQHPAVTEAVAVHDKAIEAYVATEADVDVDADELVRWCRDRLADYKLPRLVRVLPALPRTVTGKLVRHGPALRAAPMTGVG